MVAIADKIFGGPIGKVELRPVTVLQHRNQFRAVLELEHVRAIPVIEEEDQAVVTYELTDPFSGMRVMQAVAP